MPIVMGRARKVFSPERKVTIAIVWGRRQGIVQVLLVLLA